MFEAAETLRHAAWLAVAGGLGLLALGCIHLLLVYAGLLARRERGWSHWVGRRSFTAALVLLLGAALMQVVAHRGLSGRPDTAPAIAAAPNAANITKGGAGAAAPNAANITKGGAGAAAPNAANITKGGAGAAAPNAANITKGAAAPAAEEVRTGREPAGESPTADMRPAVSAAEADAAFDEALAARGAGRAADAERAYGQARDAFAMLGDARREADALHGLGDMAFARRDLVRAERRYLDARRLFAGLANRIGEANALVGLASVKAGSGAREEAARLLDEAHAIYLKAVSVRGRANVALARASLATDPARARRLYRDAAGLYIRAGLPDWAEYALGRAR